MPPSFFIGFSAFCVCPRFTVFAGQNAWVCRFGQEAAERVLSLVVSDVDLAIRVRADVPRAMVCPHIVRRIGRLSANSGRLGCDGVVHNGSYIRGLQVLAISSKGMSFNF
jgi:hypothetical protein